MKAEEAVRLLEFVKEHSKFHEKPTRADVRAKGVTALIVVLIAIIFIFFAWISFRSGWDTGLAISGAGFLVFFLKSLEKIIEYLEAKRKSKMSYAELISEERTRRGEAVSPYNWDDADEENPYDPINSYSHYWMD